ncbi:MAG: InlB B-repeat-containing protein, partial [Clostridia bacterium]
PETTEISVADYIGQTIAIVKKGNSTTTVDSEPQTLEIPFRPSAPSGIASVDESEENANDGKITGVTAAMEYRLSTDSNWADITGNEITGLAYAAYNVRFKATDESFASEAVRVVVNAKGKYIITFNNYNGSELTRISVSEGTIPSYDGTPTREQDDRYTYEFSGWDSELVAATENKTYTAQYREIPRTYNVKLNVNGGTINGESIDSYTYGTAVSLPTNITRADYTFIGWYDNPECTGEAVTEISATDTGNKIYYAGWTENKIREYLDVLDGFKEKLTIEKITDENGTMLVISPLNDEVLPTLTLYSAIYSENKSLKKVTAVSYRADENGIIRISLSEPQIDDGESYKLMLWTDNYAPVIEAISNNFIFSRNNHLAIYHRYQVK